MTVSQPTSRYVWYVIFLLTIVNVCNSMDRMALAVLALPIRSELGLSDSELGVLLGFAFALFYALCGLPIARWADRGNRRNIIALSLAVWSTMTALTGVAQNYWSLLGSRIGVGAGEAGGLAPAHSILCDYVPLNRRAGVFAIHNFGLIAGVMLGLSLAGWLGATLGWRWTFVALGLPGLALAAILRFTLREPVREPSLSGTLPRDGVISVRDTIWTLWRCRTYRRLTGFLIASAFAQYGLLQWWPSLYARVYQLDLSTVGASLGIAFGAGSGLGVLLGGLVANRAAEWDIRMPLWIGAGALTLTLPAAAGSVLASSSTASLAFVALAQLCWGLPAGPAIATLYSVVPSRMRASAGAAMLFATAVIGSGLGPLCVGVLSDLFAAPFGENSLRYAMLLPLALFPVMVIAICGAARTLPCDMQSITALDPVSAGPALEPKTHSLPARPLASHQ